MKIKIKNYEYEIKEVDNDEKDFFNSDNELRIYGQTDYEKQLIRIYKDCLIYSSLKALSNNLL